MISIPFSVGATVWIKTGIGAPAESRKVSAVTITALGTTITLAAAGSKPELKVPLADVSLTAVAADQLRVGRELKALNTRMKQILDAHPSVVGIGNVRVRVGNNVGDLASY